MTRTLFITGIDGADALLNRDGTALMIGMLLDQQVPMEWAFTGPYTLRKRLGHLNAKRIAAMNLDKFVALCSEKPAIHRFPRSMGTRVHSRSRGQSSKRLEGRNRRRRVDEATSQTARVW